MYSILLALLFTQENQQFYPITDLSEYAQNVADQEAEPTPYSEVVRVIGLLPKPEVGFVDYGCGADARWCIVAAERWQMPAVGIELSPKRAAMARKRVAEANLDKLVTIIEGDATTADVKADVGAVYLYQDVLTKLKPKLQNLKAFASYMHQPSDLPVIKNGDTFIYTKAGATRHAAVWNGLAYSGPVCNNPNCAMCNSIRAQLATPQATQQASSGQWVKRCNGKQCWMEWIPN